MLTLSIIIAVTAIAAANLRGGFRVQRLKKAADQVRTTWAQARVDAIKTGRVQVFYHSVQGNKYFFAPQASYDDPLQAINQDVPISGGFGGGNASVPMGSGNAAASGVSSGAMANGMNPLDGNFAVVVQQSELPRDITFLGADVRIDQRSSLQLSQAPDISQMTDFASSDDEPMDALGEVQWGSPIFFFPDGTTSSARLVLDGGQEQFITVYLRGLTGLGRVGRVESSSMVGQPQQLGATP